MQTFFNCNGCAGKLRMFDNIFMVTNKFNINLKMKYIKLNISSYLRSLNKTDKIQFG